MKKSRWDLGIGPWMEQASAEAINQAAAVSSQVSGAMSSRRRKIFKWIAFLLGGLILLLGGLLIAFRIALSHAPEYRAQVQQWVSERTGLDIQFSQMDARWRFYGPELVFDSAVVRSRDGQRKLVSANRVSLGFDVWAAISTFRLVAGRITLEQPELQIIRTVEGKFEVVGQSELPERDPKATFKPDAMPTGRLQVVDAQLTFRDLKRGLGPWVVPGVNIDLQRRGRSMHVDGEAKLPSKLGKTLIFTADTAGRLDEAVDLQWNFKIEARELDFAGWTELSPKDWPAPPAGRGSFTLAGVFTGADVSDLSAKVQFKDVVLALPSWRTPIPAPAKLESYVDADSDEPQTTAAVERTKNVDERTPALVNANEAPAAEVTTIEKKPPPELIKYQHIGFDLRLTHSHLSKGDTWNVRMKDLELTRPSAPWPSSSLAVTVTRPVAGGISVTAQSDVLVLENLWPLLAYAPESEAMAHVRALSASGHISEVQTDFSRVSADAPFAYSLHARFSRLGMLAIGKAPGIGNMTGVVEGSDTGGRVELNVRDGSFDLPRFFRAPLPIDRIAGVLQWRHEPNGWRIETNEVLVEGADGHARANGDVFVPTDGGSPEANIHAQGWDLVARAAPRYLPANKLSPKTLEWLDRAFVAGTVPTAEFEMRGPMRAFPFRNDEGLFLIKAHVAGLTLDYQPGFIPATGLGIDVEFRNVGMTATLLEGQVNGLPIIEGTGRFVDFKQAELLLKAKVKGDLGTGLGFVQQSPIGPLIGAQFMALHASGSLQGDVDLKLPFKKIEQRKLVVNTQIEDGIVGTKELPQTASKLRGTLNVRDYALYDLNLRGEFLNGPVAIKGGVEGRYTGRGAGLLITAEGRAQGSQLAELAHLPASIPLAGAMQWKFSAHSARHSPDEPAQPMYRVESDTKGLGITLPQPLGKLADTTRALVFEVDASLDSVLLLRGSFGDARALIRLQKDESGWALDRGGVRADAIAASLPAHSGLRIEGAIDRFVLDDWLKLKGDQPGKHQLSDYLRAANVRVNSFGFLGFSWPAVRVILQATETAWRVDVAGDDVAGQLSIPYQLDASAPLQLALTKLNVGPHDDAGRHGDSKAANDPRDVPAIAGRVDEFRLAGRLVGVARFALDKVPQGVKLTSGELRGDSFTATARGSWLASSSGTSTSSLVLDVASTDVRETLRAFNFRDLITGKHANAHAALNWPGGVDEELLGRASGKVLIEMADGQLLGVEPGGAGRMLGLMSVGALPRRLALDFSDVTDKGISFDKVHADFELNDGEAYTNNLFLSGPQAEVGIVGRTGLGKRDYDLTAVATGDIGGSLSVASAVILTPVVGAAVLAFTRLFKEPLKGVTRRYYHVTGPWENPVVDRIDKEGAKHSSAEADAAVSESQKENAADAAQVEASSSELPKDVPPNSATDSSTQPRSKAKNRK